jgi:hypothetical protein
MFKKKIDELFVQKKFMLFGCYPSQTLKSILFPEAIKKNNYNQFCYPCPSLTFMYIVSVELVGSLQNAKYNKLREKKKKKNQIIKHHL